MSRDARDDPRPGDRWRTAWGVRTVREVTPSADCIELEDGEGMPFADWRWYTRPPSSPGGGGGWTYVPSPVRSDGV